MMDEREAKAEAARRPDVVCRLRRWLINELKSRKAIGRKQAAPRGDLLALARVVWPELPDRVFRAIYSGLPDVFVSLDGLYLPDIHDPEDLAEFERTLVDPVRSRFERIRAARARYPSLAERLDRKRGGTEKQGDLFGRGVAR
jgi:hypothetical protein